MCGTSIRFKITYFLAQRTRRSANISPLKLNHPSNITALIDKKYGVIARKVFNSAKEALAAVSKSVNVAQSKASSSSNVEQKRRHVKKIRPPPPPFIALGNQSYKVSCVLKNTD